MPYAWPTIKVYTKQNWADTWTERPTVQPTRAVETAAPEISVAQLLHHYGRIKRESSNIFADESPLDLLDHYVKIESNDATIRWVGIIAQVADKIEGIDAADPSGVQTFTAYGLEHLLDRTPIRKADAEVNGDAVEFDYLPTFNIRHQRGGTLIGNRSSAKMPTTNNWAFTTASNAQPWTIKNILEYVLIKYAPSAITWQLGGLIDDLDQIQEVVNLDGLTLRQALNRLIDRRRGYSWCVRTTGIGNATIHVFSIFDSDVSVGTMTFHANTEQTSWTLYGQDDIRTAMVVSDRSPLYERIRVQGARVKSCFTISFTDGTLQAAWSADEESAYKAAANTEAGYGDLTDTEKAFANDRVRADDLYNRVFSLYRIPPDWDWIVANGEGAGQYIANPAIDESTGDIATPVNGIVSGIEDRPILNFLPLEEGRDYSQNGYPTQQPSDTQPRFRSPFAVIKDQAGKYRMVDRLGDEVYPDGRVHPETREYGIRIEFRPRHILAKNHWTDTEPTMLPPAFDYKDLIATVCVETDEHLRVVAESSSGFEHTRELVIYVPDAELWIVVPGTVVGINDDGTLKRIYVPMGDAYVKIRDDADRLRAIALLALQWYGTERAALSIVYDRLVAGTAVGWLITSVGAGTTRTLTVNSVVTRRTWDFVAGRTTSETGWWNVDWTKMTVLNNPRAPDLKVLYHDVDMIRKKLDLFDWTTV